MTKTPTEEAWESLATLVETKGAHWRLTDSPADDCVDVPVADLRLALADRARLQAERDRAVDKIDGLESDLSAAVEVAYRRGAHEWVRLNYPRDYERLSTLPPARHP